MNSASPPVAFDYELYEGDPDHLRTVDATPPLPKPYIEPASLKFKHRIGRGFFGDVWLATHHQSSSDYDEYHEVAVKMLQPIQENHIQKFLFEFDELWLNLKSRQLQGICWLHGISVISGKICIAMKFCVGSLGDKMARLKGGKLPLPNVLRYGIELAKGIQELHSIGMLVLNLKPTNFLLDENDQVVLGDFGIPYLLLGLFLPDSDLAFRLGTPNYMAPEQWQPEIRGPISFETDSWGFACSVIEMLTGIPPWFGPSAEEIYKLVVMNQQKPQIPSGLPPAVENVLMGCFEYDFRNRPLIADILQVFESSQNTVYPDEAWNGLPITLFDKSRSGGYSPWFLSKDVLQVGDTVRMRKVSDTSMPQSMAFDEGTVVGLEKDDDGIEFALVQTSNVHNPLRVNSFSVERVASGLAIGDFVRLNEAKNKKHSSVGVLHSIQRDGNVAVGFVGLETLWRGHSSQLKVVKPFLVGQFVRLKANVVTPRFEWSHKRGGAWASGRICQVLPNGCLEVKFPGKLVLGGEPVTCLADPDEVEHMSFDICPGIVEKYEHVEDYHWAVRPVVIGFGAFTAAKFGIFVGRNLGKRLGKRNRIIPQNDSHGQDAEAGGNSAWLPPKVANILFKEGTPSTNPR